MERKFPLFIWLCSLGKCRQLSQLGPEWSTSWKWFNCYLITVDRFFWQQVSANCLPFYLKSVGTLPLSPKTGGTSTPWKLRVCCELGSYTHEWNENSAWWQCHSLSITIFVPYTVISASPLTTMNSSNHTQMNYVHNTVLAASHYIPFVTSTIIITIVTKYCQQN